MIAALERRDADELATLLHQHINSTL